ncbi:hypothetical protein AAFN86_18305 [Roseomonas sp. CAU 1739]|uniref:hypothetical protein n=1 Tax=Roseomonas sp. CAU 1739 TaxID=3140364 RepID=UPI00325BECAF
MTVPSLTANGFMRWPLRAWVESLCTPQPDGTWLVQTPISGKQEPRLYLLPDAKTKDQYLRWATVKCWISALVQSLVPLFTALVAAANSLPLVMPPGDRTTMVALLIVGVIPALLWFLAYVVVANRLFDLLPDARRQSTEIWLRHGVVVCQAVEWDAIYISRCLALAFIAMWPTIGLWAALGMLFVVTTLDACGSVDMLAGTFLETRRLERPEAFSICRNLYLWLGGVVLAVAFSCATLIRQRQKRKAGRARLLQNRG